jgi:poly(A) polymerase Pap1
MLIPITLDKSRSFKYGLKAIALIERGLHKPIAKIDFAGSTIDDIVVIMWAGLVHEDKTLTPEALLDILDNTDVPFLDITTAMNEAIAAGFGGAVSENPIHAAVD